MKWNDHDEQRSRGAKTQLNDSSKNRKAFQIPSLDFLRRGGDTANARDPASCNDDQNDALACRCLLSRSSPKGLIVLSTLFIRDIMVDSTAVPSSSALTLAKGKKRIKSQNGTSIAQPICVPKGVVCSAPPGSRSVELGLILSLAVLAIFFFGFYESIRALPDVPHGIPVLQGTNLNLAKDESSITARDLQQPNANADKFANLVQKMRGSKNKVVIPEAKWPVSVRDDDKDFETIIHPGDNKATMSVPKFWSPPVHNHQLMTRETAMKIGSCSDPDKRGNYARGDKCPEHQRTIYLAIASYRDFQCRYTVESAFLRAKYPDRIRVGVVDQIVDGEDPACNEPIEPCDQNPNQALCKYKDRVDVYEMEAELSVGPVFARHIGHRLYRGKWRALMNMFAVPEQ